MKLAIMQPYFLPYIGYWQLINAVDVFVVYDNIKYTKKGWINRNRYLLSGKDAVFTVNIRNDSDYLNVSERYISTEYKRNNLLRKLQYAYSKAPMIKSVFPVLSEIICCPENNLFDYIYNSIVKICMLFEVKTDIKISSSIHIDHSLKSEQKVISICKMLRADTYVNAIGGTELYDAATFAENGIELKFLKTNFVPYKQFGNEFVPGLSIIDVMMFNPKESVREMLDDYELIVPSVYV